MSSNPKKKITQKDLVNALTLINDALDQLQNEDSSNQQEGEDEVVVTSDGSTVTLNFHGRIIKFHKSKSSRTGSK